MHLQSPVAHYIPPGLVVVYANIYERLIRYEEVRRGLDIAAVQYAGALSLPEKRTAAVHLLFTVRHQLRVGEALVSEKGLPVFLKCLDQFSAGEEVCEYK